MAIKFGDEVSTACIKFNAKENKWTVSDDNGEMEEIEPPEIVMDFNTIEIGYVKFQEGSAPEMHADIDGRPLAKPEGDRWKRGFRMNVYIPGYRGPREWMSNSMMLKNAIQYPSDVWDDGYTAPENNGKVPKFKVKQTLTVPGKFGKNYKPVFALVDWVPLASVTTPHLPPREVVDDPFADDDEAPHEPSLLDRIVAHMNKATNVEQLDNLLIGYRDDVRNLKRRDETAYINIIGAITARKADLQQQTSELDDDIPF